MSSLIMLLLLRSLDDLCPTSDVRRPSLPLLLLLLLLLLLVLLSRSTTEEGGGRMCRVRMVTGMVEVMKGGGRRGCAKVTMVVAKADQEEES